MDTEIPNAALTPDLVPASPDPPEALARFALGFDGYAHWGDRCGERADEAARAFQESGRLPESLSDLRACLFYEHERWRWLGRAPDRSGRRYLQALLDAVRRGVDRNVHSTSIERPLKP